MRAGKLDWSAEITRMRRNIRAQEREMRMLQLAGDSTTSAELLLSRIRAKLELDDLAFGMDLAWMLPSSSQAISGG